jgi:hypothetical protein
MGNQGGGLGNIPGLDDMWGGGMGKAAEEWIGQSPGGATWGGGLGSIPDAWRENSGVSDFVKSVIEDPLATDCGFGG